jgi:hypothetical protein
MAIRTCVAEASIEGLASARSTYEGEAMTREIHVARADAERIGDPLPVTPTWQSATITKEYNEQIKWVRFKRRLRYAASFGLCMLGLGPIVSRGEPLLLIGAFVAIFGAFLCGILKGRYNL